MERIKTENIRKLKKSYGLKRTFYPFLLLLEFLGIRVFLSGLIDNIIRKTEINRSQNIFFRYKDYAAIFRNNFSKSENDNDYNLMITTMLGVNSNLSLFNLTLAKFLSNKGYKPFFLVCDSSVPICYKEREGKTRRNNLFFCHECRNGYKYLCHQTGIAVHYFSEFFDDNAKKVFQQEKSKISRIKSLKECFLYQFNGASLGAWTKKTVLRYFLIGDFHNSKKEIKIYKKFLISALIEFMILKNCFARYESIKKMVFNNGTLIFEKIAGQMAIERNIDFISYETFIGKDSLIFKRNDEVMNLCWTEEENLFYRNNRWGKDSIEFVDNHFKGIEKGYEMYAVLNEKHEAERFNDIKEYAVLFTNLNFDTSVIDKHTFFSGMKNWIYEVIDFWQTYKLSLYLIIRIHPGEHKLKTATKEFMGDLIKSRIESERIIVVDSHEPVNSYELIKGMKFGLIYSSTIGLEIAYRNKACLVGGKPFFLNKPFVISPISKPDYFDKLNDLCQGKNFKPDLIELNKFIYYIYHVRNQHLRGFKTRTPDGGPVTIFNNSETIISENKKFFEFFYDELGK